MRRIVILLASALTLAAVVASPASATPPVGTCPGDYCLLDEQGIVALPDADLALPVFFVVDANGDGLVCYAEYPNAPHHGGHYGNLIDNTAAPHR